MNDDWNAERIIELVLRVGGELLAAWREGATKSEGLRRARSILDDVQTQDDDVDAAAAGHGRRA